MVKKIVLSVLLITTLANAQEKNDEEFGSFDDFMEVLEETTQLANKNKIGVDHAPGIINVLKHDDMKRLGVNNLYEALELLPAVEVVLNKTGTRNLVFRGIGAVDGSGKIKVMLNGVEQNSAASGIIHFNLPIEIIERIEVIRGPASALYGEYAFSGIIDIITKKDSNHIFAKYISDSTSTIGAIASYSDEEFSINAVMTYGSGDGLEPVTTDSLGNTGEVETLRKNKSLLANVKYKELKLNLAINESQKGEMWGIASSGVLPDNDSKENFKYDYQTVELSYKYNLNDNLWIEPKVGYFQYKYWFDFTEMGTGNLPPMTKTTANLEYTKKYAKLDISYNLDIHNIILGSELSNISETDYYEKTTSPMSGVVVNRDGVHLERDLIATYLHDNISLSDSIMLSIGARYDKYDSVTNNIDAHISPRVALVYDMDMINIFKIQYAEAFRIPTFLEETNGAKEPETNKMLEVQYIHTKENNSLKTTLFYSVIDSLIYSPEARIYANHDENILNYGLELEYNQNFSNEFLLFSNISYINAEHEDSDEKLKLYAPLLANLALSHKPYSEFSSTIKLRYVGSKEREDLDTREDLDATTTLDLAFRYLPTSIENLDLSFGIKNIADKELKSPSKIYRVSQTYTDDFSVSGRYYFAGIDYKF